MTHEMNRISPVIIIHGGASAIPELVAMPYMEGVKTAALEGYKILLQPNGRSLEAVEIAVSIMENNPVFNAGTGSALTEDGLVEMDACIMDGRNLRSGAVAAVRNIQNPIRLARLVMEKTKHLLLAGEGANRFAATCGIPLVDSLVTNSAKQKLEKYKEFQFAVKEVFNKGQSTEHDTVGAVAIDCDGHVACATSTGGITAKMMGRVGDSPIVGSGLYADDSIGGVSTTGHGESIMKVCLAFRIIQFIKTGSTAQDAVTHSLKFMKERVDGCGGAIAIDCHGNLGFDFSTERMAWAYIKEQKLHYGLNFKQDIEEDILL